MKLNELSIIEYCNLLAEKRSVPGGGSALSLVLEIACSLGLMVANFTINKKDYEIYYDEVSEIIVKLSRLKEEAHNLIDEDSVAYKEIMEAYKSKDADKISLASIHGCEVPYQLYMLTKECEELCERIEEIGNRNLLSDARIAVDLCQAIYPGCKDNIICNIDQIHSKKIKDKYLELLK